MVRRDAQKALMTEPLKASFTFCLSFLSFPLLFQSSKGSDSMTNINQRPSVEDINGSIFAQVAQHVAQNGEILNINDTADWLRNHPEYRNVSTEISHEPKCILCMPIVDGQKRVIGVLVYVHANGAQFTTSEISIFEAFAIFCGLGIHNTTMYER